LKDFADSNLKQLSEIVGCDLIKELAHQLNPV